MEFRFTLTTSSTRFHELLHVSSPKFFDIKRVEIIRHVEVSRVVVPHPRLHAVYL